MPRRAPHRYATLNRASIIDAALVHLANGEIDQLTIRKLANDLDVSPMALYRHVASKDEVLLDITDHLLAQKGLPNRALGWRRFLEQIAVSLREMLLDEPVLVGVYHRQPVTTPAAIARLEAAVGVLERDGFSHDGAIEAYAAVHTYTVGFCALVAGRKGADATVDLEASDRDRTIAAFVSVDQYYVGLHLILGGLEGQRSKAVGRRSRPRSAARPAPSLPS